MENELFFTTPYSIGYNIGALLIMFIILGIIEKSQKDTDTRTVEMPLDINRNSIATIFYLISSVYLIVSLISFMQTDFIGGFIGLTNMLIWAWFPTLSIRQAPTNQFGEVKSGVSGKPCRITKEGQWTFCFVMFYEWITSDVHHDEEHVTNQKIEHTCIVDNLKGDDDWLFKLNITFAYKWIVEKILEIRGYSGGSGGQTGIVERVCDILDNVCQDIDDEFTLQDIDKVPAKKEEFKNLLKESFKNKIEESGLPLEILTDQLFTIKVIFSQEYLAAMQKIKTQEKEGEARKKLSLAEQKIVLQMKKDAEKKGVNKPYEFWLDQYQRTHNQAGTKFIFEGDPGEVKPIVSTSTK